MNHAFIIMAHNNYALLGRLLKKLDHCHNTIYLHIDAKSEFTENDKETLSECCRLSTIVFTKRFNITWGGYSQPNAIINLLDIATKGNHDYYHLLSGVDFPTKSMTYIHDFFDKNNGYEFIHFCSDEFTNKNRHRFDQYHLFIEITGRNIKNPLYWIEKISVKLQQAIQVKRSKKYPDVEFKSGAVWCSITNDFARYLLSKTPLIEEIFRKTLCCDEVFIQTIAANSHFSEKIYLYNQRDRASEACLRSIDWERADHKSGSPYTYTVEDYENLVNSPNLFCRKVSDKSEHENALITKLEKL